MSSGTEHSVKSIVTRLQFWRVHSASEHIMLDPALSVLELHYHTETIRDFKHRQAKLVRLMVVDRKVEGQ